MSSVSYPNWVEVNLSAIEHNNRFLVRHTGVDVMAVVKANAYGHGACEVARASLAGGATWLAVARFGEARALRQAGIEAPTLVFGMVTPDEVDEAIALRVSLTLHSREVAELFAARGKAGGGNVLAHLKVDTGLGRLGVFPDELAGLGQYARELGGIEIQGLYSHFAMADEDPDPLSPLQTRHFIQALSSLNEAGIHPRWIHLSNSAGNLTQPDARFNLVRAGSDVTGLHPLPGRPYPEGMRRALTWKVRLNGARLFPPGYGISYGHAYKTTAEEWIGALPLGYGDGFRRVTNNEVLIGGMRVPVVGRVCMDQCMIRLPRRFPLGEEVVVIGEQGDQAIWPEDLAARWKTTQVDVTANINVRVPRVFTRDS
jgi:alanine racemase